MGNQVKESYNPPHPLPAFIYVERANELLIDNDIGLFNGDLARMVLRDHAVVMRALVLPSRNKEHGVVLLDRRIPDATRRAALRGIMGDDRVRVSIDLLNIRKGGSPSLLFSDVDHRKVWRKPDYLFTMDRLRSLRPVRFGWAI